MSEPVSRPRAWEWLFQPFRYVAGGTALALGLAAIVVTGLVGAVSATHLDGVLDLHTGRPAPWWVFPLEGVIDWLALALLLLLLGKLVTRTAFRARDLLGTQALARAPMLLPVIAALLPGYQRLAGQILQALPRGAPPAFVGADALSFAVVLLLTVLAVVWMVVLMYQSYSLCTNTRGVRAAVSFIIAVLAAEVISKLAIVALLAHV